MTVKLLKVVISSVETRMLRSVDCFVLLTVGIALSSFRLATKSVVPIPEKGFVSVRTKIYKKATEGNFLV